jgi:nitroreductase
MVSSGPPILGRLTRVTYAALVRTRRMTRRFAPLPQVPTAVVADLLDLASRAPSAGNTQATDYVVLQKREDRDRFWAAATPAPGTHRHSPEVIRATSPEAVPLPPGALAGGASGEHPHVGEPSSGVGWRAGVCAAPTLILCLADEPAYRRRYAEPDKGGIPPVAQDWPIPYWLTDTAMGAMVLLLGAHDAGLGALFFGIPGPRHDAVREAFGIPPHRALVGVIALGHQARRVRSPSLRRRRRRGPEVTHWGRFGVVTPPPSSPSETMPGKPTS